MKKADVVLDCERMKYPYTGLFEFCSSLANALISIRKEDDPTFVFYVPSKQHGTFGINQNYRVQRSWHKLFNPASFSGKLWHGTYQGTNYLPVRKGIRKILTIHDLNFMIERGRSDSKRKGYLERLKATIARADQLTVISRFVLDFLKQYVDLRDKPVEIIYNGCNVDLDIHPPARPSFMTDDRPFIFTIGTVAEKKNFHVLPALLRKNDLRLVIAGIYQDEQYVHRILKEATLFGVRDRVLLPGPVTQAEKWWLMKHCKAFVFPSLAEGFGIPVVEAMRFGNPVILSKETCLPEIGGDTVHYFESFDESSMQEALLGAISDFDEHPERSENMIHRSRKFNWDESAAQYMALYRKWL